MRWTEQEWEDYADGLRQARIRKDDVDPEVPDTGSERRLLARCLEYCKEHGYPVFHDWSRKKNRAGWPDLFIFMPKGRLVLIELKSAGRKLRTEQQEFKCMLMWLGFNIHVVRSYRKFLEIMKEGITCQSQKP